MTDWRLDHVVIGVRDLAVASAHYQSLGFTVVRGGTHPGGWTHNALIAFNDGSYLELLAPTDVAFLKDEEAVSARNFLFALTGDEGCVGLALTTDDLNAAVSEMQRRGVAIDSPRPGGRQRHDGVRLEWRIAMQDRHLIPFFIQDLTPRSLRVPSEPAAVAHANGARGISDITLTSDRAAFWKARFSTMLGPEHDAGTWRMAETALRVASGVSAAVDPFISVTIGAAGPRLLDAGLTHGAQLRIGG